MPLSLHVSPGRAWVQLPIEVIGSLKRSIPPGFRTLIISPRTKLTLGTWWRTPREVARSKLLSSNSSSPSTRGLT